MYARLDIQEMEMVRMFSRLQSSVTEMEMLMNKRIKREKDGVIPCSSMFPTLLSWGLQT